jgi:hypothetical protein
MVEPVGLGGLERRRSVGEAVMGEVRHAPEDEPVPPEKGVHLGKERLPEVDGVELHLHLDCCGCLERRLGSLEHAQPGALSVDLEEVDPSNPFAGGPDI